MRESTDRKSSKLAPKKGAHTPGFNYRRTPLYAFLRQTVSRERPVDIVVGRTRLQVDLASLPVSRLSRHFADKGIHHPLVLAERVLAGIDLEVDARAMGISQTELIGLCQVVLEELSPQQRAELEWDVTRIKATGGVDIDDPDYDRERLNEIREIGADELNNWNEWPGGMIFQPLGPTDAIDHRRNLGPARDQNPRGTCSAFGSTAVVEALEYLRDRRSEPRDLSEEIVFWYSKGGQLRTFGGYDGGDALRHYTEYGACEESYCPYWPAQIASNHAHVPIADRAMDRAQFYRQDEVVRLARGDIDAVKQVLRSGRCVCFSSDTTHWLTSTGIINFPEPLDSQGRGSSHVTAIIGFIDRDDLPDVCEGGYFIVRNSWGGADSTTHLMGPEYGGHLLMPYGWYHRYTNSAYTLVDAGHLSGTGRSWLAEYYPNANLAGTPAIVSASDILWETEDTAADAEIDQINYNWGNKGPFFLRSRSWFVPDLNLGPNDHFSARYTQLHRFRAGWYRFSLRGDDGFRLWVDDRLVINAWKAQSATECTREHYLSGGDHVLRVEYFERTGVASLRLRIDPIEFHYEVFDNKTLRGNAKADFRDTATDLEWRHAPPIACDKGHFSLRATGKKYFAEGTYRFFARHTGRCKIWVGDALVLDEWKDSKPSSPITLSAGTYVVKVEFCNLETLLAPGEKGYYRAALAFDWSEDSWQVDIYDDEATRKPIADARYPDPGSLYEAFRTQALAGSPVFSHRYEATHNLPGEYLALDGPRIKLEFDSLEKFKNGIAGSAAVPQEWLGAHIRRRIYIEEGGQYIFRLVADGGSRLIVDGRQLLQEQRIRGSGETHAELNLSAGVHDIAIEYTNALGDGLVKLQIERVEWAVDYHHGTQLNNFAGTARVDKVDRIVSQRPPAVGNSNFSLWTARRILLPVGRYRVQVRADNGVRLSVDGRVIIDAWIDHQSVTTHTVFFEHRGGEVLVKLEYYHRFHERVLEMNLVPEGYLGEYYRSTSLEKTSSGSTPDRNVPVAYRFEEALDFDWGKAGHLPRIGSEGFSARWFGSIDLPVGRWVIKLTADDGVRLYLDGRLVIDEWKDQSLATHTKMIDLVGRRYDLCLEYYERTGNAICRIEYERIF